MQRITDMEWITVLILAAALVFIGLLQRFEQLMLRGGDACTRCRHQRFAHKHFRPGRDCSMCNCLVFLPSRHAPKSFTVERNIAR